MFTKNHLGESTFENHLEVNPPGVSEKMLNMLVLPNLADDVSDSTTDPPRLGAATAEGLISPKSRVWAPGRKSKT